MNLRYLEILESIEETGSFTGAAAKLHLTQSAVSHAMAELEEQAGTALFVRLPRGVRLTRCGEVLLEEARGILSAGRNLDSRMRRLEEDTPVHMVSSITIASFLLPAVIRSAREVYPEFRAHVQVASAVSVMEALRKGEADIAFWEGAEPQEDFETILLGTYSLCAVCTPEFFSEQELCGKELTAKELCKLPLLLREKGSAIRDAVDSRLLLAGQQALPLWESVNSLALVKAAEAGLGITVLPEELLEPSLREGRLRRLSLGGIKIENKMLAVFRRDMYRTKPLKILLKVLKRQNTNV